jgi:uncharacterized protein (TIGR02246 family)
VTICSIGVEFGESQKRIHNEGPSLTVAHLLSLSAQRGSKPMQSQNATRCLIAAAVSLLLTASFRPASGSKTEPGKLPLDEEKAIKATIEAYRTAWLANDSKAVLRTFTDDAVVLPAHGAPAVVGIAAIEKYWFSPGGPSTTITQLDIIVDQVSGNDTLAFARGVDAVGWTVTVTDGTTRRHFHPGTYLNVMKKMPDGSWRIQVHMWDDGPENVE